MDVHEDVGKEEHKGVTQVSTEVRFFSRQAASRAAIIGVFVCLLLQSGNALAYLDPNAGGMIFQILFPVIAAVIGWWTLFKRKLGIVAATIWSRLRGKSSVNVDESNPT